MTAWYNVLDLGVAAMAGDDGREGSGALPEVPGDA